MKNSYALEIVKGVCKQKIEMIITWKIFWKVSFSGSIWLFQYFKKVIFIFYFFALSKSKWESAGRALVGFNSDTIKQHWEVYLMSKWPSPFFKFFKNVSPFLCHFVTYKREYYEWFCRLTRHIQIGRLPVQTCLYLDVPSEPVCYMRVHVTQNSY